MVLPTQRAPARKSCSTHTAFATAEGCESRHVGLPQPVFQPATSITSLTAKHNPSSMPLPVGGSSNVVRKALLCATLIEEHFIPGTLDGKLGYPRSLFKERRLSSRHSLRAYFPPSTLSSQR